MFEGLRGKRGDQRALLIPQDGFVMFGKPGKYVCSPPMIGRFGVNDAGQTQGLFEMPATRRRTCSGFYDASQPFELSCGGRRR